MYTIDNLEADIQCHIDRLRQMRADKGHDYSGAADTLDNLREFGSLGILVRIGDKFKRLKHFYSQKTLRTADEKIIDTMDDLINYSLYLRIMHEQEHSLGRKRLYIAGSIRGPKGDSATIADMEDNVNYVCGIAEELRTRLPADWEFYVPHKHEALLRAVYLKDKSQIGKILAMDKDVIALCDAVVAVTDPQMSLGVAEEVEFARCKNIPTVSVWHLSTAEMPEVIIQALKGS